MSDSMFSSLRLGSAIRAGSMILAAGLVFILGVEQLQAQGVPVSAKLSLQSGIQEGANGRNRIPIDWNDPAAKHLDSSPAIYIDVTFADGTTAGPHDYHQNFADNVVFDDSSGDPQDLIKVSYWDVNHEQPELGKFGAQLNSTGKGVGTAELKVSFRNAPSVTASVPVTIVSEAVVKTVAPAIHVILVADIKDAQIGVQKDLERWRAEIARIQLNTQTTPSVHTITDRNPNTILDTCENLKVNNNDTVIFFYGGHGFNKDADNDTKTQPNGATGAKWPEMVVYEKVNGFPQRQGLPMWQVFTKLKEKNPRLLLVIGDCCNEFMPAIIAPPTHTRGTEIVSYYKTLYLTSKGHFIVSAARVGQFARGDKIRGGYFTEKFFEELVNATTYDPAREPTWKPSWDQVFKAVSDTVLFVDKEGVKGDQQSQWELNPTSERN